MELNEYKKAKEDLKNEFNRKDKELDVEYAKLNQLYKKGDLIGNCVGKMHIDDIEYSINSMYGNRTPEAVYFGYELTKKMKQRKDKSRLTIYQSDVI